MNGYPTWYDPDDDRTALAAWSRLTEPVDDGAGAFVRRVGAAEALGYVLRGGGAGLAVAVPSVLAYNAFVRSNRVVLAKLDAFAHDLFSFLTTGSHLGEIQPSEIPRSVPKVVKAAGA